MRLRPVQCVARLDGIGPGTNMRDQRRYRQTGLPSAYQPPNVASMNIELREPYKSIHDLRTEVLPDFAILIGRNGSGKTQLLEALSGGSAVIPGVSVVDTEFFDMSSFRSPNTSGANRQGNYFAKATADAYLLPRPDQQPYREIATAVFDQFGSKVERTTGGRSPHAFEHTLRDEVRHLPDFTVFAAGDQESPYHRALYQQVLGPLTPESPGRRQNSFNGNRAALLSTAMKITGRLAHELTRDDILRAGHYEGETIANSISEVFTAYKVDQYTWAHTRLETERVDYADLIAEYQSRYRPPWETLREILSAMRDAAGDTGLFDFEFSDPDEYQLNMGNYEGFGFKSEMTNRTTGAQYELDSLSSGEKVLMALCVVSFNQYLGRRRPKLLLLDELDAVLHPSMARALVETLKTLFVAQGTKVLMTSHSPMTVAAVDEADIFRVVRKGSRVEVSGTTKAEAINELSEGIATVDVGLKIAAYEESTVTILTEGHNTKHLKKWVDLSFPEGVRVFDQLEQHTSASQLLAYGRLIGRMTTNTHFVIVWDCDAAHEAETLRRELPVGAKVTPFAFERRVDNGITKSGIENNYDEKTLERFAIIKSESDGRVLGRELPKDRKTKFADHVLHHGTADYFVHFEDLHAVVSGILDTASRRVE